MFPYLIALGAGMLIGFLSSAPFGPVTLVCIQRTLSRSRASGLITGFGAAVADGIVAIITVFGVHQILHFMRAEHSLIRVVSGVLLLAFGIASMWSKPRPQDKRKDSITNKLEYFFSAIALTLSNPFTPITFLIAFTNVQSYIMPGLSISVLLVIGTMIGSSLWWLIITHITDAYEHKIDHSKIASINKWLGALVTLIGVMILTSSVLLR